MPVSGRIQTREQVETWLETQGYALEHVTASRFRDTRTYNATQGLTYFDAAESKVREIDVIAVPYFRHRAAELTVVVECKGAAKGPWIVRTAEVPEAAVTWLPAASEPALRFLGADRFNPGRLFKVQAPTGFAVVEASDQKDDATYRAISQLVSAAFGVCSEQSVPHVAMAALVLDAPLYTLTYSPTGEPDLQEVNWRRVLWRTPIGGGRTTAVDIVTSEFVTRYATNLYHEWDSLNDALFGAGMPEYLPLGP